MTWLKHTVSLNITVPEVRMTASFRNGETETAWGSAATLSHIVSLEHPARLAYSLWLLREHWETNRELP